MNESFRFQYMFPFRNRRFETVCHKEIGKECQKLRNLQKRHLTIFRNLVRWRFCQYLDFMIILKMVKGARP